MSNDKQYKTKKKGLFLNLKTSGLILFIPVLALLIPSFILGFALNYFFAYFGGDFNFKTILGMTGICFLMCIYVLTEDKIIK